MIPWWRTDKALLRTERQRMESSFPQFLLGEDEYGRLTWTGALQPYGREYVVRITHPPERARLPLVHVISPRRLGRPEGSRFRTPDHWSPGNQLCVAAESDWRPPDHDAATVVAWTAHWLSVYEKWYHLGGSWPVAGYLPR